ncbi:glycophorin-A [Pan troglodytes]|uniref:glycophorin-A n=1 Tax=Pan troglodytes TaxID=9598 RepID=UPI002F26AE6C
MFISHIGSHFHLDHWVLTLEMRRSMAPQQLPQPGTCPGLRDSQSSSLSSWVAPVYHLTMPT